MVVITGGFFAVIIAVVVIRGVSRGPGTPMKLATVLELSGGIVFVVGMRWGV